MRAKEFVTEKKKRKRRSRSFGGYWYPGYGYYGSGAHGGESSDSSGGDGGGGESVTEVKNSDAVTELKAALLAKKDQIQSADDDDVYAIIDRMMTRIAKSHDISGKELHDLWVGKYKQIPDKWIMKEDTDNTSDIELRHEPTNTGGVEVHAYRDGQEVGWVRFSKLKTGQVKAAMVHVPERFRRQGVASAMYRYARQELGLDIVPSDSQTDQGRAFWNKVHENFTTEAAIEATDLVDVFIRGKHKGETITRLVARAFPNQQIPLLIRRLERDHGINPSAVVYGPSRTMNEDSDSTSNNVIFIGDDVAIVGQEHSKRLQLRDQDAEQVRDIAQRHGAWYEGNGMDQKLTRGIIDRYQGSWDDDLLSPSIKGYPAEFLYVLFSNIKENDTVEGKIGSDPDSTIFDRILDTQPSTNYFPDRQFDAKTLTKFLQSVSEGPYDFVAMSQAPATEKNVRKFFTQGERLMFPDNWEEYPYRAGRVAKSVNDLRDKFLATRKQGVYVAGSDHLRAVQQFLDQNKQEVAEGANRGGIDLEVTELPDDDQLLITATSHGKTLGRVYFDIFDTQLTAADAEVASEYRGQGIAAIIYDYAKELGWEVVRSGKQTADGAAFWDKHKPGKDIWEQGVAEVKQPGKTVVDAIQQVLPVAQEIWFHGSRATGKHRKNSDTDILVVVPDDLVGDQYLGVVRILQKLSTQFDNHDIQPTKAGTNIHRIAQEEGQLLWSTTNENFADGKNPGRKGLSRRVGIPKKASLSQLKKIAQSSTGERRRMAQWQLNMRRGKQKKNK